MLDYIDPSQSYSLYVHIPFCGRKCDYCAFYSEVPSSKGIMGSLSDQLESELGLLVDHLRVPFDTIYFGGGDPGMLPIDTLVRLLSLSQKRGKARETTMEMNPEHIRKEHSVLFSHGMDRLSVGIQSMNGRHLSTLGRNATIESIEHAMDTIRSLRTFHEFRLNCDLMTCIPGQTIPDALEDIDSLVEGFAPDHISLYNLTVEEGTPLANRMSKGTLHVMDEDEQAVLLHACWEQLEEYGYVHYEVSNFSIDVDHRSKHNERYWKLLPYIGLGPSAAGTLFLHPSHAMRSTGVAHVAEYCAGGPFSAYHFEEIDRDALMLETILVALRTSDGIDIDRWNERFSDDFNSRFGKTIATIMQHMEGVCILSPHRFSLTGKGFMVLDSIVLELAGQVGPLDSEK